MNSSVRNSTLTKPLRGIHPPHSMLTMAADRRQSMVAEAAYYFSEHRGFAPGHELDDWLAAENQIDREGENDSLYSDGGARCRETDYLL